jgi:ribonuclease HII
VFIDSKDIDKNGLSKVTRRAIYDIMGKIDADRYIFDGNTTLGIDGLTSMIRGDLKIKSIGAASILAKVSRDIHMIKMSNIYKSFSFSKHKGYGTKNHIKEITQFGYLDIHRSSFNIRLSKESM